MAKHRCCALKLIDTVLEACSPLLGRLFRVSRARLLMPSYDSSRVFVARRYFTAANPEVTATSIVTPH